MAAAGLSACGHKEAHPTVADNEGFYVDAGPVTYQVQLSRELNPYSQEDRQYLVGLHATPPKADQEWFAVFVWAKNQTSSPQTTTNSFDIVDTQGNKYYPLKLNAGVNPYAWTSQSLAPGMVEPNPTTTAGYGPTGGRLLLFKLGNSVYDNRPLTLQIRAPSGNTVWATISLDL